MSEKTLRQILKGPCKLLALSMCAMGHSHTRFIPLVVLIMCAFYLLCKDRNKEACNKPAFPIINLQDGTVYFGPIFANIFSISPCPPLSFFTVYTFFNPVFFFYSLFYFSCSAGSSHFLVVPHDLTLITRCQLLLTR